VKEAHQLMKGDVFLSDKTYWVVKEIDTDTQIEITPGLFIDDVGFTAIDTSTLTERLWVTARDEKFNVVRGNIP
jgi:hypothetical protein